MVTGLCFVFVISLSKVSNKLGKTVKTQITPSKTPLAITSPKSFPKVKLIVHKTKKPAIVVKLLPVTEENVSMMASTIASLFFKPFSF